MKYLLILMMATGFAVSSVSAQVIINRMDSTLKIGKVGYRVDCRNKSFDVNLLTVRPEGFGSEARQISFPLRGRVLKAEIDDLNADNYPDLVLYVYSDSNATFGTVYAFLSQGNKSITGCVLPDPMLDGKINQGYRGHDKFTLLEGNLLQKFPIYKPGDDKDHPTGGTRFVLYNLVKNDSGDGFKFQLVRTYDSH